MNSNDGHVTKCPSPPTISIISSKYSGIRRVSVDLMFVSNIECVVLLCRCPTVSSNVRLISVHTRHRKSPVPTILIMLGMYVVRKHRIQNKVVKWDQDD